MTRSVVDFISSAHRHIKDGELLEKMDVLKMQVNFMGMLQNAELKHYSFSTGDILSTPKAALMVTKFIKNTI